MRIKAHVDKAHVDEAHVDEAHVDKAHVDETDPIVFLPSAPKFLQQM